MDQGLYWNTETLIAVGIGVFVLFSLLAIVLWNKKTNTQVNTLKSIDGTLKNNETAETGTETSDEPAADAESAETAQEEETAETAETTAEEEPGTGDTEPEEETSRDEKWYNVTRRGRVYTKEELEEQIKE